MLYKAKGVNTMDREKKLAYQRQYAADHPEQIKANHDRWVAKNRDRYYAYQTQWKREHPEAVEKTRIRYYTKFLEQRGYTVIKGEI